jgi:hypothetical protein
MYPRASCPRHRVGARDGADLYSADEYAYYLISFAQVARFGRIKMDRLNSLNRSQNSKVDGAMQPMRLPNKVSSFAKFSAAQNEALNAAQWLARMSLSYADHPVVDNVPYLLNWSPSAGIISSPEIAAETQLQLRLPEMAMEFAEKGQPVPHRIYFDGKSPAEVEAWLLVEMLHRGIERENFTKALPYSVPNIMSGDAVKHSTDEIKSELELLTDWLVSAGSILVTLRERLAKRFEQAKTSPPGNSALLFWPTNFQIGFCFESEEGSGITKVSFSLGSAESPEPRFLVSKPGDSTFILPITHSVTGEQIVKSLLAAI